MGVLEYGVLRTIERRVTALAAGGERMSVPIRIDGVTKTFPRAGGGRRVVLDDFSLHVEAGELVALVGPSGGGKTTILHLVAGLDRPRTRARSTPPRPPVVGMVFQQPRLLDVARARARTWRWPLERRGDRPRARRASSLHAVGDPQPASGRRSRSRTTLSGGQRHAARGRTRVRHRPAPRAARRALQPRSTSSTARRLRLLLQELWLDGRRTGLLVSHNPLEAALLADRVVVLGTEPASIVAEHRAELPRPRHPEDESLYHLHRTIVSALV